jgi:hypothetical protein
MESETIRRGPGTDASCQSTLERGCVSEPFGSRRPDGRGEAGVSIKAGRRFEESCQCHESSIKCQANLRELQDRSPGG